MKVLVIDTGIGAGHALDLHNAGLAVDYYIPWFSTLPDESPHLLLSGIVSKVLFPEEDYDVVVVADVGYHSFSLPGYVIGYSPDFSKLEVDRILAKHVFQDLEIPVAEYVALTNWEEQQNELSSLSSRFPELVVKTNWRGNFETKILTNREALVYLSSIKEMICEANPILVERKIDGKEIGFDLLVTDKGLSDRIFYGYASHAHAVRAYSLGLTPLWIRKHLEALGELAYASGFRGMFSAEFIVDRTTLTPYILEVAARFPYMTSLIYTYNYGFYDIIRAVTEGFHLVDTGKWMAGIPVFSRDRFGEVVIDKLDNYMFPMGSYQFVASQIYKIGNEYRVVEWPIQRIGAVYGSGSDLKVLLESMVSEVLKKELPFEIGVEEILDAQNFFAPHFEEV